MLFHGTIAIVKEDEGYAASCLENYVSSCGDTIEESIANLKEAISLYYKDEPPEKKALKNEFFISTLEVEI